MNDDAKGSGREDADCSVHIYYMHPRMPFGLQQTTNPAMACALEAQNSLQESAASLVFPSISIRAIGKHGYLN
jgi:hypothetical protein